jgi:lipopolysaccharide export system protein LptC
VSWRAVVILLLSIGAFAAGWAVWRQQRPPAAVAVADKRPDYVLHDFELIALDGQGKESFTLRAPRLERRPDDATMSMATPLFLIPNADGQHWEVRSKQGWVSADQEEIRLSGEVKANSPSATVRPVTMNTETLRVYPRRNHAETDDVMTIVQPGSILSGRGFAVSTATKKYVFRSEVKTRYVPARR